MKPKRTAMRSQKSRERQVAMAFPLAPAHLHTVMRGIVDYAGEHGGWLMTTHGELADLPIESLRGWAGNGIIAILTTLSEAREAARFCKRGIPVVTFSGILPRPGVPR